MNMAEQFVEGTIYKESEFSEDNIERYVEGCSEVALTLGTVTERIRESGKRPVVLIPSRGAVPIYLLAHEALKTLDSNHFLVNPAKVSFFPKKIFEYLSQGRIPLEQAENTQADIILYPFTADVSTEKNGEEWLARKLRESCTRAFYDLIFKTNQYPEDLYWYYFLMGKMQKDLHGDHGISPGQVVEALKNYPGADNSEIVLIDTVISGRAAQDIISSFAALGSRVTPILAVDTKSGGHFQQARKGEIERSMHWDYMSDLSPFINFPLITEDKGAALLGVAAVNFANFNKPGFFREVDQRFKNDFLPQSCIWTLPPGQFTQIYVESFYKFINLCLMKAKGEKLEGLEDFQARIRAFITGHGIIEEKETKMLTRVENGATAKETASHIISISLADKQARDWVREYASILFQNSK